MAFKKGHVKIGGRDFQKGHPYLGGAPPLGEKHSMWKGDNVGYVALHHWIRKYLPKPKFCEFCNTKPPHDAACITGNYSRDFVNWKYLCKSCHMRFDYSRRHGFDITIAAPSSSVGGILLV